MCTLATMDDGCLLVEENNMEVTQEQKQLLYNQVEELKCSNADLLAENDMLEKFIARLEPMGLPSLAGGHGPGAAGGSQLEGGGGGWRSKSRSNVSDRLQLLTLEQKLYVARREIRATREEQEKLNQQYEIIQDDYKASMKEAEMRLAEIRKAKNEFERRLLKPLKENKVEMKEPEKVLQYIEDKSQVTQLERFTLNNQGLKANEKKLLRQLQQKKEKSKAQYQELFVKHNELETETNLDEVKNNSLKAQRTLSSHKVKLESVMLESEELSSDITKRKQMLAKIEEELQRAEEERLKAEALNRHLRRQLADYQAPDITEYMHVKDRLKKLQQNVHTCERRVGIAEMALKSNAKVWSQQKATLTPANSAEAGTRSREHQKPVKLPYIEENSTQ